MSFLSRSYFLLVLTLSSIALREAATAPPAAATDQMMKLRFLDLVNINVFNVRRSRSDLTIHCKSGDGGDLGDHVVGFSQLYGFQFRVNLWRTTAYSCAVSWPGSKVEFDIYTASRDLSRCPHYCLWMVTDDAIMGFEESGQKPDIVIAWR